MDDNMINQANLQVQQAIMVFTGIMAVGTLLLAAFAIAGDRIRDALWQPSLTIHLNSRRGELVRWQNGALGIYYHLKVENHGRALARQARVLCLSILKKRAGGTFYSEQLTAHEQLSWRFADVFGILRDIPVGYVGNIGEVCDLGSVNQGSDHFQLAPYASTVSFPGFIKAGESMQVNVVVAADNFVPKQSCSIEISWDGQWTENLEDMQRHLVIKEVETGGNEAHPNVGERNPAMTAENTNNDSNEILDFLLSIRQDLVIYHNHKENMEYLPAGLFLSVATYVAFGDVNVVKLIASSSLATIAVAFSIIAGIAYVYRQFSNRQVVANMVDACTTVATMFLAQRPTESDLAPARYRNALFPKALADEFKTPSIRSRTWRTYVTAMIILATMLVFGLVAASRVASCKGFDLSFAIPCN